MHVVEHSIIVRPCKHQTKHYKSIKTWATKEQYKKICCGLSTRFKFTITITPNVTFFLYRSRRCVWRSKLVYMLYKSTITEIESYLPEKYVHSNWIFWDPLDINNFGTYGCSPHNKHFQTQKIKKKSCIILYIFWVIMMQVGLSSWNFYENLFAIRPSFHGLVCVLYSVPSRSMHV